jgi:hypothetical protein
MTNHAGTYQVGVMTKLDWNVLVFKRDLTTGAYSTYDLTADAAALDAGITPILSDALGGDDHWMVAVGIDDQNRTYIAGNSLPTTPGTGTPKMIRSAANSISSWTKITYPYPGFPQSGGNSLTGSNTTTYNFFHQMMDGRMLYFLDQRDVESHPYHKDQLGFVLPLGATNFQPLVDNGEIGTADDVSPQRYYLQGVAVERSPHRDRVWLVGAWRLTWDDVTTQTLPHVIYNDNVTDKTSWKDVTGGSVTMPLTWVTSKASVSDPTGATAVHPTVPIGNGTSYAFGSSQFRVDLLGRPHFCYKESPSVSTIWHYWWDGSAWQKELAGSTVATAAPFILQNQAAVGIFRPLSGRMQVNSVPSGGAFSTLMGGSIPSQFVNPMPDPVQITNGNVHLVIPDGDTPKVWTLGDHARRTAV